MVNNTQGKQLHLPFICRCQWKTILRRRRLRYAWRDRLLPALRGRLGDHGTGRKGLLLSLRHFEKASPKGTNKHSLLAFQCLSSLTSFQKTPLFPIEATSTLIILMGAITTRAHQTETASKQLGAK